MGCPDLTQIDEKAKSLQDLKIFMKETASTSATGENISKLNDLAKRKSPMHLCYCGWHPRNDDSGCAAYVSAAYDKASGHRRFPFAIRHLVVKQVRLSKMAKNECANALAHLPDWTASNLSRLIRIFFYS
jgi:hypothetical protein